MQWHSRRYAKDSHKETFSIAYYGRDLVTMDTKVVLTLLLKATVCLCFLVADVQGEIRCYCNDASCVRTGYMCKSSVGRCFSQLTYERDATRSIHGCAETLPIQDQSMCAGTGMIAEAKTGERVQWPILICCNEDMCNYMDNLDINIYVTKSNGSKDPQWTGSAGQNQQNDGYLAPGDLSPYSLDAAQRDLWFKAAVIAVPIAGGFILVLLVLLAIRVLKNDNRRHRQLVQMRHHRSLTKAQLYVADHFYHNELVETEKLSTNLYENNCSKKSKSSSKCSINSNDHSGDNNEQTSTKTSNVYKDVHVKLEHKHGYEKIRPVSDGSLNEGSCNSVVLWGNPNHPDSAASV